MPWRNAADDAERPSLYGHPVGLSRRRVLLARLLGVLMLAVGVPYLLWRTTTLEGTGILGPAVLVAEACGFVFVLTTAVLVSRHPPVRRPPSGPSGNLDILVPVCGEPGDMVRRTLEHVLAIGYPHRTLLLNDGRVAGKHNWSEVEEVAREVGVECVTRTEGRGGKAANLNSGLARCQGDLVAVIDADHRVDSRFAHETLGYFADPAVALVTTPQEFEGHEDDVLNNSELFFYACVQPAKDAVNSAISCGNATVYRRSALDAIGGFSEWNVVEDVHTTYLLHARGLRSVYHPRPLTVGTAPQTAGELARQRLSWAVDNLRILIFDSPLFKPGLTGWQRAHYTHLTSFYLVASLWLAIWLAPPMYLLWGLPALTVDGVGELLLHAAPYYGAALAFLFAASAGSLSSVRGWAQKVFLSPVYALAAVIVAARARIGSRVTEKVEPRGFDWIIIPSEVAAALTVAGLVAAIRDWGWGVAIVTVIAAAISYVLAGLITAVSGKPRIRHYLRTGLRILSVGCAVAVLAPPLAQLVV